MSSDLTVFGGPALARVDSEAVLRSALQMGRCAQSLRTAGQRAMKCAWESERLAAERFSARAFPSARLSPVDGGDGAGGDGSVGGSGRVGSPGICNPDDDIQARIRAHRYQLFAQDARVVARQLSAQAEQADGLALALRKAAGLYQQSESLAHRAVGGLSTLVGGTLGFQVARLARPSARVALAGHLAASPGVVPILTGATTSVRWLLGRNTARQSGSPVTPSARVPPARVDRTGHQPSTAGPTRDMRSLFQNVYAAMSPYLDEVLAGLGAGIALVHPRQSGGDLSLRGGAQVLSHGLDAMLPDSWITTTPVSTPRTIQGGHLPASWVLSGSPPGSIEESLARVNDMYPNPKNHIPGRMPAGTPEASIGVQRLTQSDGGVTWQVLIPGTQSWLPTSHPFDGKADIDMVAAQHGTVPEIATGVSAALTHAGAKPHEPVVLVGHSLGGIAATAIASTPQFTDRFTVGGVVTAGAPVATLATKPGIPVVHVEHTQDLVTMADGKPAHGNPRTDDRVTISRSLASSDNPRDQADASKIDREHMMPGYLRTVAEAKQSGNYQAEQVIGRVEELLGGESGEISFYTLARVPACFTG